MTMSIRRTMRRLRRATGGNATMLLACGMPAVIGGACLAVDVAQWYIWKRDLQFAVDQAALAGAWTMTNQNAAVQQTYATGPVIELARYGDSPENNSVRVSASATQLLSFSSLLTGAAATVTASAQATYATTTNWIACLLATSPSAPKAFKFGGSVDGSTTCGVGTLSNDPTAAMFEAGNTNNNLGNPVATGGIDSSFSNYGKNRMHPNTSGLSDPFAALSAPSASGNPAQVYACSGNTTGTGSASTVTTATVRTRTRIEYLYKIGSNANNYTDYLFPAGSQTEANGYLPNYDNDPGLLANLQTVPDGTIAGGPYQTGPVISSYAAVQRQGGSPIDAAGLAAKAHSIATAPPYGLNSANLGKASVTPAASRVAGASEFLVTYEYSVPNVLHFAGIGAIPLSYSRPIFVLN